MKRFRFFWICLAAMIITSFVIPEASAAAETSRILIIASELDEADQPHVIGSFEMPDGRIVWHLEYEDTMQAQDAMRAYALCPHQEDLQNTGTSPFATMSSETHEKEEIHTVFIAEQGSEESLPQSEHSDMTVIETESGSVSSLCAAVCQAMNLRTKELVLLIPADRVSENPVLLEAVRTAVSQGIVLYSSLEEYEHPLPSAREISSFDVSFLSGAEFDSSSQKWVWTPDSAAAGHRLTYRISFSLSGIGETGRDSMRITIPRHILKTRDGRDGDEIELSVPFEEDLKEEDELGWRYSDSGIEIFNNREESAGLEGYVEVSYLTSYETFEYRDGSQTEEMTAHLDLPDGSEAEASAQPVLIDTNAGILSTLKRYPVKYETWNSAWMEKPEDSANEEYLIWEIRSQIRSNITQPYTFTLDDQIFSEDTDTRVIGYWFCDTDGFTAENSITGQTIDQLRTDYVLTAHKRSSAERIVIENHVTATVKGEDGLDEESSAVSSASYSEEKASFQEPVGSFGSEKYGNQTVYGLDLLKDDKTESIGNLAYHMIMEGYPYQWTREAESDPLDPSSYGRVPVTYTLTDEDVYLNGKDQKLNPDDYRIDSLGFSFAFEDAQFNEASQSFEPVPVEFEPEDTISLYVLSDGEYVQAGKWSLFTDTWSVNDAILGFSESGGIEFKKDCAGFRIETENAHYHMRAELHLNLSLRNTAHVKELIKDQDQVTLTNTEKTEITQKGGRIASMSRSANDMIRAAHRNSDLKKRVIASANDQSAKEYTISWRVTLQETKSDETGIQKPLKQSSGIFYDLLPAGSTYREYSLRVETADGVLDESMVRHNLIPDFRHSGRTLLKVEISQPADEYRLFYDTVHTWESIRDYGTHVLNPVAYQTGNGDIADGKNDSGEGLSEYNRKYFTDLDETSDEPRFIYTEQPHDIAAITSALSGLTKKVRGQSGSYAYSAVTAQDQLYSYRLRFETASDSYASDMVFFDSLETYRTAEQPEGGWKGTLQSIDVSQLRSIGIDPVIYISTVEDLDISEHHDLTDDEIWIRDPQDLSSAAAVAIDMGNALDGTGFTLEPSHSVAAVLYMKAPHTVSETDEETFNNVWMYSNLFTQNANPEEYLIHQDFTSISLRVLKDVSLLKVSASDPDLPVPGISFSLSGQSVYGTHVNMTAVSDSHGNVRFRNVEQGTYALQETGSHENWLRDEAVHTVRIDSSANVWIDDVLYEDSSSYRIFNQPRVHGAFIFRKMDSCEKTKPVADAVYRLSGQSVYGNEIVCYGRSSLDGTVTMDDIEPGTYTLKETESPAGFIMDEKEYTVVMNTDGSFICEEAETDEQGRMVFRNEPFHSLKLIKLSSYDGSLAAGAVFRLKGTSDDGTETDLTETSDQRGTILFEGLRAGTYILQEIKAPEGYEIDRTIRAVRINHDGTAVIENLEKNEQGSYLVLNMRARTGAIRIIKRWQDDGTRERPVPLIHLSTEKPKTKTSTVTIDKERWIDEEDTGFAWIAEALWFEENTELTKEEVQSMEGVIRVDDEETDSAMYIWQDGDGWQWWSDADVIYLPEDSSGIFQSCTALESLDLSRFNTENIKDMSFMFSDCFSLSEINLPETDALQVEDMSHMFQYCQSLTTIDLGSFSTNKVSDLGSMFIFCSNLTEVDLSSFDTSNVERMDSMFSACRKLTTIYVSELWSTESVVSGENMFKNCRKLPNYNKSEEDYTNAHTGEGGYLTLKETASANRNGNGLFTPVMAEEPVEYVSVSENFITSDMSADQKAAVMASEDGFWEMLDADTWVYTFPVVDESREYWFYEDEPDGWVSSASVYNPGIVENQTGTIINFSGTIPEYGEMLITKDVVNDNDSDRKFRFTVTLRNEKGEPLHGTDLYGDTPFENGIARLLIGSGETYRITGIPAGYMYLVEEDSAEGYETVSTGASGVISDGRTVAHFTNTRFEYPEETATIRLKKILSGRYEDMDEEKFTFHIFLGGLEPGKQYVLSDGQIYFADDHGGADFSYTLAGDEYVDLMNLPVGSTYQICEEGGDYLASYEITDGKENEGIVSPSRLNDRRDRFLSTAVETIHSEDDITVTFTNRFDYVQNIKVQKLCEAETDEEFEFRAEFNGLESTDRIECELGDLVPDENGKIKKTFFLKKDESITFRNVPVTVTYRFTEEASSWISEYTIEDLYGRGMVVKSFGTSVESHTPLSTNEETVNQFEDVLVTFTNTPAPVSLEVTKQVDGNMGSKSKKFSFTLDMDNETQEVSYEITADGTLHGAGTLERKDDGKFHFSLGADETARFPDLTPGTGFTVEEDAASANGYECSVSSGVITEKGSRISGTLSRNEEENRFIFHNERTAPVPAGGSLFMNSTAVCLMTLAAMLYLQFR